MIIGCMLCEYIEGDFDVTVQSCEYLCVALPVGLIRCSMSTKQPSVLMVENEMPVMPAGELHPQYTL